MAFWVLFIVLWSTHDLNYHPDFFTNFQTNLFAFIPYAILVYVNLYVLTPRLLLKKRIMQYLLFLVLGIAVTTWFASKYLYFYFSTLNVYIPTAHFFDSFEGKIAIVTEIILSLGLSMTLFLTDQWYRKERTLILIEQKRLETELSLLKNQMNPHFLFNSLNSIYVMLGKNLNQGKNMLLEFSDLLSYQLYETNRKKVSLTGEFENLTKYINIESVRHEDLVKVDYSFPEHQDKLVIAPMLLMPLVENAFKHGQSSTGYEISIQSDIESEHVLNFRVENTLAKEIGKSTSGNKKGIGLENVKRRLALIYSNKHIFYTQRQKDSFVAELRIQLNENEVLNS